MVKHRAQHGIQQHIITSPYRSLSFLATCRASSCCIPLRFRRPHGPRRCRPQPFSMGLGHQAPCRNWYPRTATQACRVCIVPYMRDRCRRVLYYVLPVCVKRLLRALWPPTKLAFVCLFFYYYWRVHLVLDISHIATAKFPRLYLKAVRW